MTRFAALGGGMEKAAVSPAVAGLGRSLWNGAKHVATNGFWKSVGQAANRNIARTGGNFATKGLSGASKVMGGTTGKVLSAYGLTSMVEPLLPFELPGSQLAMNVAMPGWGALFSAPGVITSSRMASQKNQDRLKDDVTEGGRLAMDDFLSAVNANPAVAHRKGEYRKFMDQYRNMSGSDAYMNNKYSGPGMNRWRQLQAIFSDPQLLIDDVVRRNAQQAYNSGINKQAGWVGTGMQALAGLSALAGVGMTGHALLKDKPYDAESAQTEGYHAAQAAIQHKLNNLGAMERFAVRMDPTFAAYKVNQFMPGTIARWEQQTGSKFRPGWLSATNEAWRSGGKPSYYQYDAAGERHYA